MDYGRNLYQDAEDFLIKNFELDKKILESYISPENEVGSLNFNEIYEQFLLSAKNKGHGGGAIENVFGTPDSTDEKKPPRWSLLARKLCDFDPHKVTDKYPSIFAFLPELKTQDFYLINNTSKSDIPNPENPKPPVYLYCLTILDSAKFLSDFNNPNEFYEKINNDPEKGIKDLQRISGLGDALSRDLLRGLGYTDFVKSDVHIRTIAKGLGIVSDKASDLVVSKKLQNLAIERLDVTPFALDRLLWLIGSGNFFDLETHDEEQKEQIKEAIDLHNKMKKVRDKFIEYVKDNNS